MEVILGALDNREKAFLFWIAFAALLLLLLGRDARSSVFSALVSIVGILLAKKLLVIGFIIVSYVAAIVFGAHLLGLWSLSLTKETVVWFFGSALVLIGSITEAHKDPNYIRRVLVTTLKVVVVVEFLVNFYVLNMWVELALVPSLFLIGGMWAYSENKSEHAGIRLLSEIMLSVAGLSLISYGLSRLASDFTSFATLQTLRLFVLPIALSILLLPLIYMLAVCTTYEEVFVRLDLRMSDQELGRYTKRLIVRACLLRLGRVRRFMNEYVSRLPSVTSRSEATRLVAEFIGQ